MYFSIAGVFLTFWEREIAERRILGHVHINELTESLVEHKQGWTIALAKFEGGCLLPAMPAGTRTASHAGLGWTAIDCKQWGAREPTHGRLRLPVPVVLDNTFSFGTEVRGMQGKMNGFITLLAILPFLASG